MMVLSRRRLLFAGTGLAAFGALRRPTRTALALGDAPTTLEVATRTIEVQGRPAEVFGIRQADGLHGLYARAGDTFRVRLVNRLSTETLVHWHGLTPPYQQDGVPNISQPALAPGGTYEYDFPLHRPGTFWMHSHLGLQEQRLLAAPLIVRDPAEAGLDEQEVVVLLHDFTFRDPEEILAELSAGGGHGMEMGSQAPEAMPAPAMTMDDGAMGHGAAPDAPMASGAMDADVNDVEFDAYLANDRTLADPEVVPVEPGGRVRLRLINGAAATNFFIDLGAVEGELIAVDGNPVMPLRGNRFEIAISQRLDIRLRLPTGQGAYPILAQREGEEERTGIILATKSAPVRRVAERADAAAAIAGFGLERRLRAAAPLAARPADRTLALDLTGSMATYAWTLNGRSFGAHSPLVVAEGERVEVVIRNRTEMSHPMHLHGHSFQVVAIDGQRLDGALRDSVLVPLNGGVTIAFDADNPGRWAFHCHHLYHMAAGMMTTVEYEA